MGAADVVAGTATVFLFGSGSASDGSYIGVVRPEFIKVSPNWEPVKMSIWRLDGDCE